MQQHGEAFVKGGVRMVTWTAILDRDIHSFVRATQRPLEVCEVKHMEMPGLETVKEEADADPDERQLPNVRLPSHQEEIERLVG